MKILFSYKFAIKILVVLILTGQLYSSTSSFFQHLIESGIEFADNKTESTEKDGENKKENKEIKSYLSQLSLLFSKKKTNLCNNILLLKKQEPTLQIITPPPEILYSNIDYSLT